MVCACMLLVLTSTSQKHGGLVAYAVPAPCYLDCEATYGMASNVAAFTQSFAGATLFVWYRTGRPVPRNVKVSQSLNYFDTCRNLAFVCCSEV